MNKVDIYELVANEGHRMNKTDIINIAKELSFRLWELLNADDDEYFKECENILKELELWDE